MIKTEEAKPISVSIQHELKRRITQGIYKAHSYLPAERRLAEDLRTSRASIASALSALEEDGFVERSARKGTRVVPLSQKLVRPTIAVVHGEVAAAARADSLRTLQGVRDALRQLNHEHELVFLPDAHGDVDVKSFSQFGAMVLVAMSDAEVRDLQGANIPFVGAKFEGDASLWATCVDHREPMKNAVRNCVNLGHLRIAFVTREPTYGHYGKAREGYCEGLTEAGIAVDESLIGQCEQTDALSGYLVTRRLLALSDRPTAIVVARDCIAEGTCRAIEEAGLVIGRDVSVIGFDDTTWPAGRDFLTTFREPCYEMGVAAAEMLVDRIMNPSKPPEQRTFEATFVLRRTAGPATRSTGFFSTSNQGNLPNPSVAPVRD